MGDRDVAMTAVQLWKALQDRYGIMPNGYDRDLVDEIRTTLGLPDGAMPTALQQQCVTNEQLLHAVLLSLQPLAAMLSDLLRLFQRAEATMAEKQNLRVIYDFSARRPALAFDLDQFRDWTRRTTQAVDRSLATRWTEDSLWELERRLRMHNGTAETIGATLRPDVREWLATYDSRNWPSSLPVVQPTGRASLDRLLRQVDAIAASMLRQCRAVSVDRTDLGRRHQGQGERPRSADETELSRAFAQVDGDNWLGQIVVLVETIADRARTDPAFDTSGLERDVSALLDSLPTTTVTIRTMRTAVEEILSLPAWQWRHEVYAAWVLTQIVDAVNPKLCSLHPDKDGRLSFSYKGSGSHLATIHSPVHGPVAVWAELRTPLANPVGKGRTRKVQADYTLVAAPVTAAASASAVVECKQYQKASTKNFADALTDYARAYPNAKVALVNYGPASDRILCRVAAPEQPRCSIVERLRPDDRVSRERFAAWLGEALALEPPHPGPSGGWQRPDVEWATIRLDWSDHPQDLDLSVVLHAEKTMVVDFKRPHVGEPLLAWLDRDVTDGRGPETIKITRPVDQVDVVVTRYSSDGSLASSGMTVTIQTPKAHVVVHYIGPDQPEWLAAQIFQDGDVVV